MKIDKAAQRIAQKIIDLVREEASKNNLDEDCILLALVGRERTSRRRGPKETHIMGLLNRRARNTTLVSSIIIFLQAR